VALINCPDCNELISDKANACPNCGHPFFADKLSRNARDLSTKATQGLLKARNYSKENKGKAIKILKKISKLAVLLMVLISSLIILKNYYFLKIAEDVVIDACKSYIGKTFTYSSYSWNESLKKSDRQEITVKVPEDIDWSEIENKAWFQYNFRVPYIGWTIKVFGATPSGIRWQCLPYIRHDPGSYFHPYRLEMMTQLQPEKSN